MLVSVAVSTNVYTVYELQRLLSVVSSVRYPQKKGGFLGADTSHQRGLNLI